MSQFLLQVRQTTRRLGLADATEQSYTGWIRRYILFHHFQSADEISRSPRADIEAFLIHLADEQQLSASSINQALSALIFLYKQVLHVDLPYMNIPRPKSVKALQLPLDDAEAAVLLSHLSVRHGGSQSFRQPAIDCPSIASGNKRGTAMNRPPECYAIPDIENRRLRDWRFAPIQRSINLSIS